MAGKKHNKCPTYSIYKSPLSDIKSYHILDDRNVAVLCIDKLLILDYIQFKILNAIDVEADSLKSFHVIPNFDMLKIPMAVISAENGVISLLDIIGSGARGTMQISPGLRLLGSLMVSEETILLICLNYKNEIITVSVAVSKCGVFDLPRF